MFPDTVDPLGSLRWTAFRPWPCALLGETRLRRAVGPVVVQADLERAFALSCQLGNPCGEAAAAPALGLSFEARGDLDRAMTGFAEARQRCTCEALAVAARAHMDGHVARALDLLAHAEPR